MLQRETYEINGIKDYIMSRNVWLYSDETVTAVKVDGEVWNIAVMSLPLLLGADKTKRLSVVSCLSLMMFIRCLISICSSVKDSFGSSQVP